MQTRMLALSFAFTAVSAGACNCDNDLHGFPGRVAGTVCSLDTGAVLPGEPVSIVDADGATLSATTDDTGAFAVDKVAAGGCTLTIGSGDSARTADLFVESGRESRFTDEACHPPVVPPAPVGEVDGCVCDDDAGAWVVGANVYVITDAGAVFSTGTDQQGCFALAGVPVGAQVLKVQKGAFYREYDVTVADGGTFNLDTPASCEAPPPPAGSGTVEGRVCAPDGETWLADATVYVERADGTRAQTSTDADGHYTLTGVPEGSQTVLVTKGSFSSSIPVTVTADQTTTIPDDQCAITSPEVKIAVVTGQYDHVENVLNDIGVDSANVDIYQGANFSSTWVSDLLDDYATLSQYDIVFLNCGLDDGDFAFSFTLDQTAVANIRQFVTEGGSVYASDWAYSIVERAWPDEIDFYGNDAIIGSAKTGNTVTGLPGVIVDSNLAAGMGSTSIALDYPLIDWVAMQAVAPDVTVYITADAPLTDTTLTDVPHTVGFNAGAGRVLYTSFHQEPGVNQQQERVLQLLMFEL